MPNFNRGEVKIIILGKNYIMRPTFQTMCEIESITGLTITELLVQFNQKKITLENQISILKAGILGYGGRVTDIQIEKAIKNNGAGYYLPIIAKFLKSSIGL